MAHVRQGSLEWPFINETRWLCVDLGDKDDQESHRIMLHAGLGIVFDSHEQCPAPLLVMEARMMGGGEYCACHLLALWLEKVTPLDSLLLYREAERPNVHVATAVFGEPFKGRSIECEIRGQSADMNFLKHIAKRISPRVEILWV